MAFEIDNARLVHQNWYRISFTFMINNCFSIEVIVFPLNSKSIDRIDANIAFCVCIEMISSTQMTAAFLKLNLRLQPSVYMGMVSSTQLTAAGEAGPQSLHWQ
jgi:hypothetical protein